MQAEGDVTPAFISDLAQRLRAGRDRALAAMPVADIVRGIDQAMAILAGADATVVRRLAETTGYSAPMVRRALGELPAAFGTDALERLLRRELRQPAVLEGFVVRPEGGHERAYGPALTVLVLSGNVFPVAVESVALALLARSACLIKAPARDPLFSRLLVDALVQAEPRLGEVLAVVRWAGGDVAVEEAAFGTVDAVVVYGGVAAVAGVRARTPAGVRLVVHGPKVSLGVVAAGRAADWTAARAAALDVSLFDQQGCVSPHTLYIEGDADAALGFARLLAGALAEIEREVPRGALTPAENTAIQQVRGAAEFRAGAEVFASPVGTAWTVVMEPDPEFARSCLNRLVYVKPLGRLTDLPSLLEPVRSYLQTVGVAGDVAFRLAVAEQVGPLGAARVCPLGRMQAPPADWRHDGRPRLLDLLCWVDVETGSGERDGTMKDKG